MSQRKLQRNSSQRSALLRSLITSFLEKERITTTLAKAKTVRPLAEKMITLGRTNSLHARRRALQVIYKSDVAKKLFDDIGPRFSERPGGYTRIIKMGPRAGDGAEMAILEMVGSEFKKKTKKKDKVAEAKKAAAKR
ncbi:MAG: 50S ribosomal protein L17 [Acidobacteria bacterium]|nr:50S ribosomal protein L17 [Acidobacteriota bacterium]MBU1474022.1 50S ribosomal protein L17 [Acidobacteriota bacterium]MBU4202436.1 50S ribosomal protein L17 [Acidobacteriota bacterium]MBU4254505.1 50S ribosomal protein L17 [Acidobacteriota bacterium]MBU4329785.1 50S ribosomal protein L17 [Acidobacteriota bacterium]